MKGVLGRLVGGSVVDDDDLEVVEGLGEDALDSSRHIASLVVRGNDCADQRGQGLNGIHVTNWGAHDPWCWKRSSWPPGLIDDLVGRFGNHPVDTCDAVDRSLADYDALRTRLIAGVERKAALLRYCLERERWDFFFGVFSESHCAGHQFWHLMDPDTHGTTRKPATR